MKDNYLQYESETIEKMLPLSTSTNGRCGKCRRHVHRRLFINVSLYTQAEIRSGILEHFDLSERKYQDNTENYTISLTLCTLQ